MGEGSKVIFHLFGILDVTGEVVMMWIILAIVTVISLVVKHNLKERPGVFQNMIETGVEYLDHFFRDLLGQEKSRKYFYHFCQLFRTSAGSRAHGLCEGAHILPLRDGWTGRPDLYFSAGGRIKVRREALF